MQMTSSKPRIAFLEHLEGNVLTDAISVTLQDPSGSWGIREALSENVAVPPGVPTVRVAVGQYEYNIDALNNQIEYEIFWKVVNTSGNIEYILGIIPKLQLQGAGSGGPVVPEGATGIPVDFDMDGYVDGYAYDLEGNDGYYESYDTNGDGVIDAIDKGTVLSPNYYYGSNLVPPPANGGGPYSGGQVFDARGVRVGLGGEIGGSSYGVVPPPDGIPDVPSPRGTPAGDGIWGGMPGYDGTSGYVPATGGDRTNRDDKSDKSTKSPGFWNGISYEGLCVLPISPRGQCIKDQAHAATRVMLKDTDPSCFAFSEDEIDMYLETSLWAFNAKPTFTCIMWDSIQNRFLNIIVKGAVVWALYSQSLLEAGREFTINENGISYTPPPVSDKMQSYASALLAHYEKELQDIKQNFRPIPAAVGMASVLEMSGTSLRRLRHLRERRII
jgi:hypothetical protein